MRKVIKVLAIAFAVGVFVAGCRTAPVYNIEEAPVVTSTDKSLSTEQVKQAIIRAGGGLGWVIDEADKNHLVGTLRLREHMAKVDIKYSPKSYSIEYKDSSNLKYDGGKIHQNYNGWVQNLQQRIQSELSSL